MSIQQLHASPGLPPGERRPLEPALKGPHLLRPLLVAAALASAGVLSVGTSKAPSPTTPQPAGPSQAVAAAPGTAPPTAGGPDAAPPGAKGAGPAVTGPDPGTAVVGSGQGLPRLPLLARELPDGLFHGYLYSTTGARQCNDRFPTGAYVKCAVDRGRLAGCGRATFRSSVTVYCQNGVFRSCRVDATGRLRSCGAAYSGWTVTEKRDAYRRCCIHGGRVKYCTNARDYVCTAADRRRLATRTLPVHRPAYRSAPPVQTEDRVVRRSLPRRGSWQKCDLFNGRVSFCRGWYHGQAVVFHNGAYRSCRLFNGQISSCGTWFQGQAVAYQNGAWRSCRIFNGRISHCGTWYRGQAAVYRER